SDLGTSAIFTPSSALANGTLYTATVRTGVKDLAGNALASNYLFTFTTGVVADTTKPTVKVTSPSDTAVAVPVNRKVTVGFSELMDPLSITSASFLVTGPGVTPVTGTVAPVDTSAVFTPSSNLANNTQYTCTITTGAKDLAGNAMANNFVFTFTTGALADVTVPIVILVNPADLATEVAINSAVHATFSKDMDQLTISTATFTLKTGVTPVSGIVVYDVSGKIATFTPSGNLAANTPYTATVTTGAKDLAGNAVAVDYVWSFTTANAIVPPPVSLTNLGSASSFGIMATSAITNTGAATMINGDVSLDPGTSNGLLPVQVNGTIHINDTVSAQARIDLLAAYNYYTALAPGVTVPAGMDLGAFINGGLPGVLPAGTYTSGSTMLISTPLTLDAKGDANAVWVFQIGSSLTTTNSVSLTNGAQAENVFWVPAASATVGVGTIFNGNIIAGVSATGQTGAVINGRILAGATNPGTIALDTNTVNVPAP
ncbi:MAG: Ig-like domain-containing protein, partial [Desulfuromonadaceae bacterium]|nr:Ig-like domain-containing protein [Desulfuromonadaceae bacterium]